MATVNFGDFPLLIQSIEDGLHTLADTSVKDAETCGVLPTFPAEQLDIMAARARAYGFKLVFPTVEAKLPAQQNTVNGG